MILLSSFFNFSLIPPSAIGNMGKVRCSNNTAQSERLAIIQGSGASASIMKAIGSRQWLMVCLVARGWMPDGYY
jgi:hypothetical protein